MKLTYVIKFVGDMDRAVAFHRDTLGLPLKFTSPHWSEFATGETTLALHPASEKNPPGPSNLGLASPTFRSFTRRCPRRASLSACRPPSRISVECLRSSSTRKAAASACQLNSS